MTGTDISGHILFLQVSATIDCKRHHYSWITKNGKMLQLNYDISWIIRHTELQEIPCILTQAVVNKEEVFKCLGILKSHWNNWLFLQVSRGLFGAIRCNFKFLLTSNFGIFVFCYQVFKRVQKSFRSNQHSLNILGMCLRWNLVFLLTITLSNAVIFLVHGATC